MTQTPRTIRAETLTAANFAPYGQVIERAGRDSYAINAGTSQRFSDLAQLETDAAGRLALSIFRADAQPTPSLLYTLERHPLGSQAFVPLAGQAFIVVVAADNTMDALRAFVTDGAQGINFRRSTWHHPLLALSTGDFLVADRLGPGNNCEEIDIRGWEISVVL
ncbi:MAG: ureidoglycolate lyase [Rhodocyclaceae bacterium]|nr:ureidoglycolate lyase [Rhodocyclaceae bacterium]